ncbi:hypothetical protein ABT336_02145 [Micromonospora sp. NPDC000207]|uniref:hypothetical protein n=1 Tax=Micromonospora sp. NPDC000207 TaxID=3154246 RepID=UPI003331169D
MTDDRAAGPAEEPSDSEERLQHNLKRLSEALTRENRRAFEALPDDAKREATEVESIAETLDVITKYTEDLAASSTDLVEHGADLRRSLFRINHTPALLDGQKTWLNDYMRTNIPLMSGAAPGEQPEGGSPSPSSTAETASYASMSSGRQGRENNPSPGSNSAELGRPPAEGSAKRPPNNASAPAQQTRKNLS